MSPEAAATDSLAELLRKSARQDRAAFQALYDASAAKLFGVVLRILRRRDWAEDAVEDAYLRIWQRAADFRPESGTAIAWMIGVARNRAIDILRKRREVGAEDEEDGEDSSGGWSQDMSPEDAEAFDSLIRCVRTLEDEQHDCLLLAYYYGLTHTELADRLEKPVATIKGWIRRGLDTVRRCLEAQP